MPSIHKQWHMICRSPSHAWPFSSRPLKKKRVHLQSPLLPFFGTQSFSDTLADFCPLRCKEIKYNFLSIGNLQKFNQLLIINKYDILCVTKLKWDQPFFTYHIHKLFFTFWPHNFDFRLLTLTPGSLPLLLSSK